MLLQDIPWYKRDKVYDLKMKKKYTLVEMLPLLETYFPLETMMKDTENNILVALNVCENYNKIFKKYGLVPAPNWHQ